MMGQLRKVYIWIGRAAHSIISPFLRPYFKHNTRVRVLIFDENDNILLVRSWFSHQLWSLPGGGIGINEAVNHAAIREVREETGLTLSADQLKYIGEFRNVHKNEPFLITCLQVRITRQHARIPVLRKLEIINAQWFPLTQLPASISPTVRRALSLKE